MVNQESELRPDADELLWLCTAIKKRLHQAADQDSPELLKAFKKFDMGSPRVPVQITATSTNTQTIVQTDSSQTIVQTTESQTIVATTMITEEGLASPVNMIEIENLRQSVELQRQQIARQQAIIAQLENQNKLLLQENAELRESQDIVISLI